MPLALQDTQSDDAVEEMLEMKVDASRNYGDLSNGGRVGNVDLRVAGESGRVSFKEREKGRPTVRNVWLWNGTPSTIPLSFTPDGKTHDSGMRYLMKRHCTVCNFNGFYGQTCPECRKAGREIAPPVPCYYLSRAKVPENMQFFGTVDCFVQTCVRKGKHGFLDDAQMRQHAMSRHRQEYRAFQDSQQSRQTAEMDAMRAQLNALLLKQVQPAATVQAERAPEGFVTTGTASSGSSTLRDAREPTATKSGLSDEQRAAISARQKKVWAERKAKKQAAGSAA